MPDKILVTYATRAGSTVGVAEAIAKTLAESGAQVDLRPMTEVSDLTPYHAVVAGSAIRGGKWLPEAMKFMKTHQAALKQKRFAAFLVCITMSMASETARQGVPLWMKPVRDMVPPVSEGYFAGALDFSKLPMNPRILLMRLMVVFGIWKEGDHRDWDAIRAWAASLKPLLGV